MTRSRSSSSTRDRVVDLEKNQIIDNIAQKQRSFLHKISNNPIIIGGLFFSINFIYLFLSKWVLMKYCNYPMVTLSLFGQVLIVIVDKKLSDKPPKINSVEPQEAGSTYEFTKQDIKLLLPVAFLQILYLTLTLYALKMLNIAVLDTLKRMAPLFNLRAIWFLVLAET